jgi:Tfp pilus assembly protein PilO
MITAGVLAGISVLAVALLVSPLIGSPAARQQNINELRAQLTAKSRQVEPLRGIDKKVPLATEQIDQFYRERFSAYDSEIASALSDIAKQNGVKIEQWKFRAGDKEAVGLRRIEIETTIQGDYQPLAKFLNGLERSKLFFIINTIGLAQQQQNGPVMLQMKLETYEKVGG